MTTQTEALKLALEALKDAARHLHPAPIQNESITAIKEVLAQPAVAKQHKQEPVAYGIWNTMIGCGGRMMMVRLDKGQDGCTVPLYTTPPQRTWVGLTDEDIQEVRDSCGITHHAIKTIEAKLKEKNT